MQHVFICGAKSIGRYGGYETFVKELAVYSQKYQNIKLHILCKANGEGCVDETKLVGVTELSETEFEYYGAHCIKICVPNLGAATAIWYDTAAVSFCLKYCKEHHIEKPIFYILTCRIGPMIGHLRRRLKKLDGQLQLNPDGHEWRRQKWPTPVRKYWKLSEQQMVRAADLVICDSVNIEKYIQQTYRAYHPKTTYIPYGADIVPSTLSHNDPVFQEYLKKNGLTVDGYYLVVCRFVPENNIETILREFLHSDIHRKLAIIMTQNPKYYNELNEKLHFEDDPRICFLGAIYEQNLLKKIRECAYAYLHGHEVGGTNPSLLESLGATKVNLLLNVPFNQEVALDSALYWSKEPGSLAALLHKTDSLTEEERNAMGEKAQARIRNSYSWQFIADEYERLWSPVAKKE